MPGAFLDRASPPGPAELVEALGPEAAAPWDRVARTIEATYDVRPEDWFFGRESGWVARYRRSGRSLVVLLPERGRASAIVVIGPSVYPTVAALSLEPSVREALEAAHEYPEGRWVRVALTSEAIADDVIRLVRAKAPVPRSRRRPATEPEPG